MCNVRVNIKIWDVSIGLLYENNYPKIRILFVNPKKIIIDKKFDITYYTNQENIVNVEDSTILPTPGILLEEDDTSWVWNYALKFFRINRAPGRLVVWDLALSKEYRHMDDLFYYSEKIFVSFETYRQVKIHCSEEDAYAACQIAREFISIIKENGEFFLFEELFDEPRITDEISLLYELFTKNLIIMHLSEKNYDFANCYFVKWLPDGKDF